jgi:hypothetical protein
MVEGVLQDQRLVADPEDTDQQMVTPQQSRVAGYQPFRPNQGQVR